MSDRKGHTKAKHGAVIAPAEEQRALATLSNATQMLAEVRDAPSAKKLMDLASAAEHYARKAKLGSDAVSYASGIKFDAECMLGEYLARMEKAAPPGRPPSMSSKSTPKEIGTASIPISQPPKSPTLADLGITKKQSAEAQRVAQLPTEVRAAVRTGEIKRTQALRELKRDTLADRLASLPDGKYRVIYADPPWKYGDDRGGIEKADTAAAAQYPTMPVAEICAIDVRELAAPDAVLFMWATFPLLEDALRVVTAWGFAYKTAFVWDKQRSNIGNYHDARAELLLVCTRGSCPIEIDTRPKQVQSIARGKHSAKPEEFRALIDQLYPTGPRVELFRRGDAPEGWVVWGNESVGAA